MAPELEVSISTDTSLADANLDTSVADPDPFHFGLPDTETEPDST